MFEKSKQEHHNKGEQDGAKGNYDPPATKLATVFSTEITENVKAYDKGFENATNQKK
jgi:hypothetical protein